MGSIAVSIILICYLCIIVIALGMSIMNYVFMGLGLMQMGRTMGEKAPWLSWIPYANQYLLGKLAVNKTFGILLISLYAVMMVLSVIYGFFCAMVSGTESDSLMVSLLIFCIIVVIVSIAVSVLYFIACHKLFKKFSDKATLMTVFNVLTSGSIAPIFIFAIRNNKLRE